MLSGESSVGIKHVYPWGDSAEFPSFTNSGQMLNGWTSRGVNTVQYRPNHVDTSITITGSVNRDSYVEAIGAD